jgi:hypothetical protein
VPDTEAWDRLTTASNWAVITELEAGSTDGVTPPTTYFVQVRAVDRSGNVVTSAIDSTATNATLDPEAGWSNDGTNEEYISAAPVLLSGATDVAYGTILTDHITASGLDAGVIKAGTISVGGVQNIPDFFIVYDVEGNEIGRWDQNGLVIVDPDTFPPSPGSPTAKAVRVMDGVMSFSLTYNPFDSADPETQWTTAISGDGIVADAILLGTAPGGHNAIPNASFELAIFASLLTAEWEASEDWATTIGTDVNVTKNTADLRLTSYTFA